MTPLSDLPVDLVDDIINRIPITCLRSFRSTCKTWRALTKTRILGKASSWRKQFMGFIMMDSMICSMKFNLEDGDFINPPSIKDVSRIDGIYMSRIFQCEGLLLCLREKYNRNVVVWNPYLGLTKWIEPRRKLDIMHIYAFGFDKKKTCHKILNYVSGFQIYDFSSKSWKLLEVNLDCEIWLNLGVVTVNGNAYFVAQRKFKESVPEERKTLRRTHVFLLCFDFTEERFGSRLNLPVCAPTEDETNEMMTLSCVREEQLAVLHQERQKLEIWISTMIEPNAVLWSKFLEVDLMALNCLPVDLNGGSFFVDEEKHIAVVFDLQRNEQNDTIRYHKAYIFGEHGYFKTVSLEEPDEGQFRYRRQLLCSSSYVPSLVKLENNQPAKRKRRGY